jgi:deazaflavin-dependent oxidoreductase (nitroreductase family)
MTTTSVHPVRPVRPTQRLPRWFMRTPELAFTLHLSRLVPWLVMVETTGRRTGKPRRVVLDVARRESHGLWVMAGDGFEARWLMNLLAHPTCRVWNRGRRYVARAVVDGAGPDAGDLSVEVFRDRPFYVKVVYLGLGKRIRSEADLRREVEGVVPVFLEELVR